MKRREFIVGIGGATVTLSFAAHAQQSKKPRRVGILMGSGPSLRIYLTAFLTRLEELGWKSGRNLRATFTGGVVIRSRCAPLPQTCWSNRLML